MTAPAAVHGARGQHWVAHLARHAHARPEVTALRCGELAAHPDIAEVAVVGRPHLKWEETPVAVLVPVPGRRAPSLEELRDHARRGLAPYKLPTGIEVVERLPRNASGKVLKFELRDGRTDDRVPG
ncbi:AMP-binding enzyme [Actinomadura monticuli]|uniref:AMP-binding enzyme C-terminal domain-containing protein n=1 Tax=Actinomadura monticuli TaxID=3097367 RepID=A0ABV4Q8D1_9ACTN